MGRLEVGMDAELLERLGRGGPDGADAALSERRQRLLLDALLAGNQREVVDLGRGGKERDIEFAGGEPPCSFVKRRGIFR